MPLHVGKGRNISTAISDIIDYVENPQKTDFGKFIYGYECDTRLADAEFLLSKRQYSADAAIMQCLYEMVRGFIAVIPRWLKRFLVMVCA